MNRQIQFIIASLLSALSSCTTAENGKQSLSTTGIVILILVIVLIFQFNSPSHKEKEKEKKDFFKNKGLSYNDFTYLGSYAGGHPSLNVKIENVYFIKNENNLLLYKIEYFDVSKPEEILNSEIPISDIDDITIEDSSSIENKITLGRVILVGIFALAWKKKKKNELSFVIISWKKGKFQNNTIFSIEGKDAFIKANKARNKLISVCSEETKTEAEKKEDDWFKKEFDN